MATPYVNVTHSRVIGDLENELPSLGNKLDRVPRLVR